MLALIKLYNGQEVIGNVKDDQDNKVVLEDPMQINYRLVATQPMPTVSIDLVSLYTSDLDYLLDEELVKIWCSGHIHHNFNTKSKNGTLLLSNQFGKPKDNIKDFSKDFIVKL